MKKLLSVILCLSFSVCLFGGKTSVSADEITVELDGAKIEFDVNPEIIDGRTMVPLRKIFEEIGAFVKWDDETRTVSARKNAKTITLSVDSTELHIDKGDKDEEGNPITETVTLEVPAQIVSDRTLVPARAISESFGLNVDWDENNQKVIITSEDDEDDSWKENIGSINLDSMTYEGEGIAIDGNQIKITAGGDFTLTGILADGNITISTKEKVKLRLSGVKITSSSNPCIFVEDADKAYITLTDDSENVLVAENSDDGAIYSKENLEIKGDGELDIEALAGHGIKASDNLKIENGVITINAEGDGIHVNDTFKMTGGRLDITSIGDGIDCESIVNITDGIINIETNGTPVESTQIEKDEVEGVMPGGMRKKAADAEFEKSTKGINAEWMMVISGGEININSASHAIHCQDETEINGGILTLSSKYDKGISAHGNLIIGGVDTVIDITKSTEGIESKSIMTVNAGTIKVVSSDDALNATGGNSGVMHGMRPEGGDAETMGGRKRPEGFVNPGVSPEMPEDGNFRPERLIPEGEIAGGGKSPGNGGALMHGGRSDMKACLIINGGYFELCGGDDCIDANGTLIINGGTIKASNPTGSFSGNFGVLDADGQITISEKADIILACSSGNEKSLSIPQNYIIVYFQNEHTATDSISISDADGNAVYEYLPGCSFKTILIASEDIKDGESYTVKSGNEAFDIEISEQITIVGTPPAEGEFGFGRGRKMPR